MKNVWFTHTCNKVWQWVKFEPLTTDISVCNCPSENKPPNKWPFFPMSQVFLFIFFIEKSNKPHLSKFIIPILINLRSFIRIYRGFIKVWDLQVAMLYKEMYAGGSSCPVPAIYLGFWVEYLPELLNHLFKIKYKLLSSKFVEVINQSIWYFRNLFLLKMIFSVTS